MLSNGHMLLVDDAEDSRSVLKDIFSPLYDIIEIEDGKEALDYVKKYGSQIDIIILDLVMPGFGGQKFLTELQKDQVLRNIPVVVATSDGNVEEEVHVLELGAADFVVKPFDPRIIRQRVNNIVTRNNLEKINLENDLLRKLNYNARLDELTGIFNKQAFYETTSHILEGNTDLNYILLCWNIEGFKIMNDRFGKVVCDNVLKDLAQLLSNRLLSEYSSCGRLMADQFAACIPWQTPEKLDQMISYIQKEMTIHYPNYGIILNVGIYEIRDIYLSIDKMCDRANLALESIKGNFMTHFAFYEPAMRDKLLEEREIIADMENALEENQYVIYLQPQFDQERGCMTGAEVLTRWFHPRKGMIAPGIFVPIFERNGFISKLDEYVWEKACCELRRLIDNGHRPIPFSVNVSRIDLYAPDLAEKMCQLTEKYQIPKELLHLEITESLYSENPQQLVESVLMLQKTGFHVEIDDFGSGFSSLNMLRDIPFDMLKLDMRFLTNFQNIKKGDSILRFVIGLAQELGMPVIAEGVETSEQADYMKSLGCNLIQGYYYAKPMPVERFEIMLKESVDNSEISA